MLQVLTHNTECGSFLLVSQLEDKDYRKCRCFLLCPCLLYIHTKPLLSLRFSKTSEPWAFICLTAESLGPRAYSLLFCLSRTPGSRHDGLSADTAGSLIHPGRDPRLSLWWQMYLSQNPLPLPGRAWLSAPLAHPCSSAHPSPVTCSVFCKAMLGLVGCFWIGSALERLIRRPLLRLGKWRGLCFKNNPGLCDHSPWQCQGPVITFNPHCEARA